jgi:hypothetical protein
MLHPQWQVYARRYANGLVLVNPTEETREVDLGATYHAACPQGGGFVPADGSKPGSLTYRVVQHLTLAPHQGAVLLTECPAP